MKIIVVGIGKLGEYLSKSLVKDGNEVTLIDLNFDKTQDIINNEDVNYVCGNGLDSLVLEEAGISDADLLISVTSTDEQNLMCSLLGKTLGCKNTIARIRTPEYYNSISILKEKLGLSMTINPELLTAAKIARALSIPSALEEATFFKGRIQVVSLRIKEESALIGETLNSLSKKFNQLIICAIERNKETIIPDGETVLELGDKVHITGTPKNINKFLDYADLIKRKIRKVMICGGSNTAIYLSRILIGMNIKVKIIEVDRERCKVLSEKLPEALIINGDMSDQYVLREEGLEETDAIVTLTSIDEENIVCSMFASMNNVPKIITKINHIDLDGVVEKANIDTVITPHKIANNQIVQYVRAIRYGQKSSCEAIYKFEDDTFEMLEFKVNEDFKGINKTIKEMKLKNGIIIVAILRENKVIYPNGTHEIRKKDTIVVIDANDTVQEINDILR